MKIAWSKSQNMGSVLLLALGCFIAQILIMQVNAAQQDDGSTSPIDAVYDGPGKVYERYIDSDKNGQPEYWEVGALRGSGWSSSISLDSHPSKGKFTSGMMTFRAHDGQPENTLSILDRDGDGEPDTRVLMFADVAKPGAANLVIYEDLDMNGSIDVMFDMTARKRFVLFEESWVNVKTIERAERGLEYSAKGAACERVFRFRESSWLIDAVQ